LATSYDVLEGTAIDTEKTANGSSTATAVIITTAVAGSIAVGFLIFVVSPIIRYNANTVEGWDRASDEQKFNRIEQRKN
jgi:hypothetical protein